jgi:putative cardiolipin synthase
MRIGGGMEMCARRPRAGTRGGFATALLAVLAAGLALAGCASTVPGANLPRHASSALPPSPAAPLASWFAPPAGTPADDSGFALLTAGADGLLARIELIDAARRSLDLQYYIFRADRSGTAIAAALLRAADRGVRVRLLIDDGEAIPGDQRILALAAHPRIEVRLFNPWRTREPHQLLRNLEFLLHKHRLDYRMHDKVFIGDGAVALIGGRNIGDQYFQIDPQSQFGDDDMFVAGPLVSQLSSVYDRFWNSDLSIPVQGLDPKDTSAEALARLREASGGEPSGSPAGSASATRLAAEEPLAGLRSGKTPLVWTTARLVYDSPDKKDVTERRVRGHLIYDAIAAEALSVSSELLMITPYFVPSPDELALLDHERQNGVRIAALTNSLESTPELAAHAGYMHYRIPLLELGVDLHEIRSLLGNSRGSGQPAAISRYGNYALHAKLYVFDRKSAFVGSLNFDQRSKHINTEIGVLVHSPAISAQLARRFEELTSLQNAYHVVLREGTGGRRQLVWETLENGVLVDYKQEPSRSDWRRFKVDLLTLLPLDPEL